MGDFKKLTVWQKAHNLTLKVYELTEILPKEEKFGIISQLRRAAVSVESNIAEGEARYTNKEKVQFLVVARGSASEVASQLITVTEVCTDIAVKASEINSNYEILGKMLTNLIKHRRTYKPANQLTQGPIL